MNKSLWLSTAEKLDYKKLSDNIDDDNLVIGAGISGLTTAYMLLKAGSNVTLIDCDEIGCGASGNNTGKVTSQHDIIYSKLKETHNLEYAKKYFTLNNMGLNLIKEISIDNKIYCDFEDITSFIFTELDENVDALKSEYTVCRELGIDCTYFDNLNLPINIKGAVGFNAQGQFNPKKYADGLAKLIKSMGCKIYTSTMAVAIAEHDNGYVTVTTDEDFHITAKKVFLCCHFPFYDACGMYFMKLKGERSYIVAGKYDGDFDVGEYINIDNPDRSFRRYKDGDENLLLICGGNHKVGQGKDDYYQELFDYGHDTFGITSYKYSWSSQDYTTPDKIPLIGYINDNTDNIFVATGFAKWGMTWGSAAGIILSELALERKSIYESMLSPARIKNILSTEFLKENSNVAYEYIAGKLAPTDKTLPQKNNTASIVAIDGKRYGSYKDKNGKLWSVDITCTHMGCELGWNENEQSWDCPCHGSRFDYKGSVLNGPAVYPLRKYGDESNKIDPHVFPFK